ncbi:hypothetical protein A2U01_0107046, partial [Trifolium medium]|nr:hypothetical protein [Trifolium medium]
SMDVATEPMDVTLDLVQPKSPVHNKYNV